MGNTLKKAGDILRAVIGNTDAQNAERWGSFFGGWSKIVGEDFAAHSEVIDVRRHTVLVEVDHPGWIQVFQLKSATILRKIIKKYPELEIQDIRCYLKKENREKQQLIAKPERRRPPPVDENTKEYREFKDLLNRLRKG